MSNQTNKKTNNNQSLRKYVSKLKDLHKIDIEIDGDISEIIADPKAWGESIANKILLENVDKIMKARKLGEEFGESIS